MAKEYVVIRNGNTVVARVDSKQEAEDTAVALLQKSPRSAFEFGKLDKRVYTAATEVNFEYQEEVY